MLIKFVPLIKSICECALSVVRKVGKQKPLGWIPDTCESRIFKSI